MDTFLLILSYISGPFIGAVIGYFTNYLAVKMLFRPYYPKKIGKWTLPFTPGIIPKRQPALAKAIGSAVGKNLFTGDDLANLLGKEETAQKVADLVVEKIKRADESVTVESVVRRGISEEQFFLAKDKLSKAVAEKIVSAAEKMDLGGLVVAEGKGFVEKKLGFLGSMVVPLLPTLGEAINNYVSERGEEKIMPVVERELTDLCERPVSSLTETLDEEKLRKITVLVYREALLPEVNRLLEQLDIAGIVEQKVALMSVKELETLCTSVMKKELSAIVNLGALIGFLLGIVNIFL
ncbi:MAG: DUF445 family protein [Clostridia bacterium]|nr:DUF445 family protein [Clostridia bacterium]